MRGAAKKLDRSNTAAARRAVPGAIASGGLRIMLVGLAVAAAGCGELPGGDPAHKINGAVHITAGGTPGSAETVNGSVHIDANAKVTKVATVNGSVHLGAHATAESAKTVNGAITLEDGAQVAGNVESVNGALTLQDRADVAGSIRNVSGRIDLNNAHVGAGIRTVAGDIRILGASRVDGGIVVQKPEGGLFQVGSDVPRVVIGPGASVQGELRFEREVHLFVSDKATIGTVTGATAVAFSGDSPPP